MMQSLRCGSFAQKINEPIRGCLVGWSSSIVMKAREAEIGSMFKKQYDNDDNQRSKYSGGPAACHVLELKTNNKPVATEEHRVECG